MSNAPDLAAVAAPRPLKPRPIISIGAGGIVRDAHLPAYLRAGFSLHGIFDLDRARAESCARDFDIPRVYDSLEGAVRNAPNNAVFDVGVPAPSQRQVLPHLPKGSAVLIQKPMGETLAEAEEILSICKDRGFIAAVNFQLRFAPNMLQAKALAESGALGEIHDMEVNISVSQPWHLWPFLAKAPRIEILYHSIHYVDLVRSWFGNPLSVYAKTVKSPLSASLSATKSVMILDYGENRRVFIHANHSHNFTPESQRSQVQWEGTEGAMVAQMGVNLDYPRGRPDFLRYFLRETSEWVSAPSCGDWFPDAFVGPMGSLQAYVEGSTNMLPTAVEDAIDTMRTVEAAYISSERGGVSFDEPTLV